MFNPYSRITARIWTEPVFDDNGNIKAVVVTWEGPPSGVAGVTADFIADADPRFFSINDNFIYVGEKKFQIVEQTEYLTLVTQTTLRGS